MEPSSKCLKTSQDHSCSSTSFTWNLPPEITTIILTMVINQFHKDYYADNLHFLARLNKSLRLVPPLNIFNVCKSWNECLRRLVSNRQLLRYLTPAHILHIKQNKSKLDPFTANLNCRHLLSIYTEFNITRVDLDSLLPVPGQQIELFETLLHNMDFFLANEAKMHTSILTKKHEYSAAILSESFFNLCTRFNLNFETYVDNLSEYADTALPIIVSQNCHDTNSSIPILDNAIIDILNDHINDKVFEGDYIYGNQLPQRKLEMVFKEYNYQIQILYAAQLRQLQQQQSVSPNEMSSGECHTDNKTYRNVLQVTDFVAKRKYDISVTHAANSRDGSVNSVTVYYGDQRFQQDSFNINDKFEECRKNMYCLLAKVYVSLTQCKTMICLQLPASVPSTCTLKHDPMSEEKEEDENESLYVLPTSPSVLQSLTQTLKPHYALRGIPHEKQLHTAVNNHFTEYPHSSYKVYIEDDNTKHHKEDGVYDEEDDDKRAFVMLPIEENEKFDRQNIEAWDRIKRVLCARSNHPVSLYQRQVAFITTYLDAHNLEKDNIDCAFMCAWLYTQFKWTHNELAHFLYHVYFCAYSKIGSRDRTNAHGGPEHDMLHKNNTNIMTIIFTSPNFDTEKFKTSASCGKMLDKCISNCPSSMSAFTYLVHVLDLQPYHFTLPYELNASYHTRTSNYPGDDIQCLLEGVTDDQHSLLSFKIAQDPTLSQWFLQHYYSFIEKSCIASFKKT